MAATNSLTEADKETIKSALITYEMGLKLKINGRTLAGVKKIYEEELAKLPKLLERLEK